ncbi:phage tail sheath C-terminal domain-containing protein [Algibacter sp. L4_22]|uniref:phage tail sheath family protein n=1 Tax=Algibacter sp. L4_22 TaxID=2942477 RepID=UPI00201B4F6B|nr:phage tail sheath C-terminal domain-containing protein [Algibacter sp. L4_22]MCL5130477.1 phage tail sheath subtilisin-like domain-containing protein [Algibacter sp. L4_22]
MPTNNSPGVYVEETSSFPNSITQVASAIPAFIGKTQIVPENGEFTPVKINSLLEYEYHFGTSKPYEYHVTIKQKTRTNTIELVKLEKDLDAEKEIMFYAIKLYFSNGGGPCYISPLFTNANKEKYEKALKAVAEIDEVTLLVCPDAIQLGNDYYILCQEVLHQCSALKDRFAIFDVLMEDQIDESTIKFRNGIVGDLKYGAAYMPYLNSSFSYKYNDSKVSVINNQETSRPVKTTLNLLKDSNPDVYNFVKSELAKHTVILPPSCAVAGIYVQTDNNRGVWKAPANVSISSIIGPTHTISESEQNSLNADQASGKSINAIRSFPGKGTLIWGARTLAGNNNEWRYIPVRRLFNMVEESIKKSTTFVSFEVNDATTWIKTRTIIENYLSSLWRQGALAGTKAEHAFYVRVGLNETMTTQDILEGRMTFEIGLAPIRPAEFIILKFTHQMKTINGEKEVQISLSSNEITILLEALDKLPFYQSNQLIAKIKQQTET